MKTLARSVAAAVLLPALSGATIGSVITSFQVSTYNPPYSLGIFAGPANVVAIMYTDSQKYLYRYSRAGSLVGTYTITGTETPRGGDQSHLGSGYLSLVDATANKLHIYRSSGGAPAVTFNVAPAGGGTLGVVAWNGTHYMVAGFNSRGRYNRYTPSGSFAGMVTFNGWPGASSSTGAAGYSKWAAGRQGQYLVASSRLSDQPSCILDISGSGSLVATYSMPALTALGGCCGPSSSSSYGTTYWLNWGTNTNIMCYEVDIVGRNASSILPSSLGKIKAVYR